MSNDPDKDLEMVQAAARALAEHFDSVHIFATRHEAGEADGTLAYQFGIGNYYTRLGQITNWVIKEKTLLKIEAKKKQEEAEE